MYRNRASVYISTWRGSGILCKLECYIGDFFLPIQVNIFLTSVLVNMGFDMRASATGPLAADINVINMCGRAE